ncbi:hypothetical protein [Streptomyces canus]|uniref:hypothetical protein n=1 Tax=Streptomyces canus TaxID=58343 RepID=UPI003F6BA34C
MSVYGGPTTLIEYGGLGFVTAADLGRVEAVLLSEATPMASPAGGPPSSTGPTAAP